MGAEHGSSAAEFAEISKGGVDAVLQEAFEILGVFWMVKRGEFVVDLW